MPWVLIMPPPGSSPGTLMVADPVNHPNNTPGAILVKQAGVEQLASCCCVNQTCCCERFGSFPATLYLNLSGCDCLSVGSLALTVATFSECDEGSGQGAYDAFGTSHDCALHEPTGVDYTLQCNTGSSTAADANLEITPDGTPTLTVALTVHSCNPYHASGTLTLSAAQALVACGEEVETVLEAEIVE